MKGVRSILLILLILALMLPLNACGRLNGSSRETFEEEEDNLVTKEEQNEAKSGEEPEKEEDSQAVSQYLVPFAKNNGFSLIYGYADNKGKTVIEPRFKDAEPFYECGIAIVTDMNEKYGLIDLSGSFLAEPEYDYISYSDGLFLCISYENEISTTAFNEKGEKQFEIDAYVTDFNEGLSPLYGKGTWGYIDKSGEMVIALNYQSMDHFSNGIAEVAEFYGSPSFFIDTKGNDVTDTVSSGLRMFKDEYTNLFGYTDKDGNIVIDAQFYDATPFLDGYAIVSLQSDTYINGYGVIDTVGNFIIDPKHCWIKRLKNGLLAVGEELTDEMYEPYQFFEHGKKALFTPDLKKNTGLIYYSAENFDSEYVCVNDEESVYFLDKELNKARDLPDLKGMGSIKKDGDLLRGQFDRLLTVMDTKGNILYRKDEKVDLGDGIVATKSFTPISRIAYIAYPIISGLKDKTLENTINSLITDELVAKYDIGNNEFFIDRLFESEYDISRQKNLLLLDTWIYEYPIGGVHPYHFRKTTYIDLEKGKLYSLYDLIKDQDGYDFLSQKVSHMMQDSMEEMGYWQDYVTITPDTKFVLSEEGIIIYFAEYEISSYAAGMPEFLIPYNDLLPYINTEGDFWKSFND